MTKYILFLSGFLAYSTLFAQPNTEVYLIDIKGATQLEVSNFKNISNNDGYDNQPSFIDNTTLLFAKTRNGQTDIAKYNTELAKTSWLFKTTTGGEYSPQQQFNNNITAVRLDTNGLQRLYRYQDGKEPKPISNQEIAYYTFFDENTLVASILGENKLDLIVYKLNEDKTYKLLKGSGRSIHKIPNNDTAVSYTAINENGNHDIYQLDMDTLESFFVAELPIGIQDHAWLTETTLLCGSGAKLYYYDLFGDGEWEEAANLSDKGLKEITRLAVSPNGEKIAFVAEIDEASPEDIVDAHIAPFNERRLDDFANTFDTDVIVRRFPNDTMYIGRNTLKSNYKKYYERVEKANVEVKNRIVYKGYVIDEELVTVNTKSHRQATVYKTGNNLIKSMTFIDNKKNADTPTIIVDRQLEAYNNRDIDAFMKTYTQDIKLYNFPKNLSSKGQEPMRESFQGFFSSTPDLHCEIKNRIVIGNKVIDEEYITANGQNFSAVAIYEIENGLIAKVTFIR
ncbi:nuclear transport factor 2 family protein [Patiriisocius hiemis]|uniref:Nuclear transport factor 2 family protein n=1 Tax=Patiriisocius hiemis TaxID=3075604 RepID=A0ABU2Y8R4_9FLAO|nr:nuclear transport factor 2 family protein [Constantimarinum sp. W242]MDT0554553.1 nuclear transport factor 2 family protein [Constantimarinum sp. W242]